ncbi:MAG: hypothetical protein KatS3mg077_3175 [Candidatus Binatia bacterium]|nr:MAG: hypothetical protein KatS3mg077_3175 [Candidatus Binatia bacterium]
MWLTVALAGLVLGGKHALDADHLAAVATMASESSNRWRAAAVGALWGLGHTLALALAGVAVLHVGVTIPAWLTWWLELLVAVSLVGLGASALWALWRGRTVHIHVHRHGSRWHAHLHLHKQPHGVEEVDHSHHGVLSARPFAFGVLHGLAGSGALFLLVLATQPNAWVAWCYLAAFGLGSTLGMTAFSLLFSAPLRFAALEARRWHTRMRAFAASASLVVGLVLGFSLVTS